MLAAYAVRVEDSRGRRYPEPPHPYRNPFQRDRDRIIHARAFRRLENKTQVFTRRYSDHFRTRLTHTMEVAQISRTIAAELSLNVDLVEALALVHDLGHPPFGHAGERTLDHLMREQGDFFDHNLQALRTVEEMEMRYAEFHGLNLTFEVREGIVKHSHDFEPGERAEVDAYLPGLRPPLEGQLIDLADEIAYNAADLDDAFSAEMLTAEDVAARVAQYREIHEAVETQFPGATSRERFQEALRRLIDALVSGLIEGTVARVREAGVGTVEDVRRFPGRLAAFTQEAAGASRELKQCLYARVYSSDTLGADRSRSMALIAELFQVFLEDPDRLPPNYREQANTLPLHRVVCDYIAGMTDVFFRRTYEHVIGRATLRRS